MKNEFKATLLIAIPLILSNLTQIAYSLIDTAMIGVLGYKELAAASLVGNVIAIPMVIGMGLMMVIQTGGTTGFHWETGEQLPPKPCFPRLVPPYVPPLWLISQ